MTNHRRLFFAVVSAAQLSAVIATAGDAPGSSTGRPHYSLCSSYLFGAEGSVSSETESVAFYRHDNEDGVCDSSNGIEVHTSDALFCSGGDQSSFVAMAECSFGASLPSPLLDLPDADDSDEDDEDDDDDGHSSMLSNASLRRARASANGLSSSPSFLSSTRQFKRGNNCLQETERQRVAGPAFAGPSSFPGILREMRFLSLRKRPNQSKTSIEVPSSKLSSVPSSSSLDAAISVRGGAATSAAKDPAELGRRLLVAALVTILYEVALGHLLEFVKIVMQTSPEGTSYGDVMKTITGEKGFVGVWDGFVPWGVVQSVMKGGVFGFAHAAALGFLKPLAEEGKIPMIFALALAGAFGGLFQGYVLSPTLLLKTRVMTNDVFREQMNFLRTTWLSLTIGFEVVRNEGILALMKGSNIFALKRLFDWFTRFIFSDMFEALLLRFSTTGSLTTGEKIAASLMGGTLSTFSTLPLDVLVAKSQDAKKAGEAVSAYDMFKAELDEKGWGGLAKSYMNGFEARLAHVCLTTIVMKTGAPIMYDFLYGNKNE